MSSRLIEKVAVITGGSSGIGLATAKLFAAEGAKVFVTGRDEHALNDAAAAIGNEVIAIAADSSINADLDKLFNQVLTRAGKIDVLFVNAGGGSLAPLGEITESHYDDTFNRNVKAAVFTVQKALPILAKGSSVILMGSTTGSEGTPAFSIYSASKAAVRNLARSWILDLKGRDIRINVLSPGATRTPGLVGLAGPDASHQQGLIDSLVSSIPMGRLADPDEIAKVALFLASDEASYVTGAEIFVDGGKAQA